MAKETIKSFFLEFNDERKGEDRMREIHYFSSFSISYIVCLECAFYLTILARSPHAWFTTLFVVIFLSLNIAEFLASYTFKKIKKGRAFHTLFKIVFF